jgi:hypothetical protein
VDYSFFGLKDETIRMAPREAMQFGKSLQRILQPIVDTTWTMGQYSFYRIWLYLDGFYTTSGSTSTIS